MVGTENYKASDNKSGAFLVGGKVMEELKKELAEIKEILSKLLAIQQKEFDFKYDETFEVQIDTPQKLLKNTISEVLDGR